MKFLYSCKKPSGPFLESFLAELLCPLEAVEKGLIFPLFLVSLQDNNQEEGSVKGDSKLAVSAVVIILTSDGSFLSLVLDSQSPSVLQTPFAFKCVISSSYL